jgi:uncharacterized protein (TIGR01777 family)
MKILVTGATGLIGRSLCRSLTNDGHAVIALSRSPTKATGLAAAKIYKWNPQSELPPAESLDAVDAVVHLAGEPIAARRWTDEQKKRIRDSRVVSTIYLVDAINSLERRPSVFVSGSAVGFYGDRGDEILEEASSPGIGFMSDVCREWELEAERATEMGLRVALVRTGVVLSLEGGALQKMIRPFKLGVAGKLGSGQQWFPWIHIEDIVGIFRLALFDASLEGAANGTAPEPVTNAEFTKQLARALHRPAFLPVPEFGLRALMGEMADVLLSSQRVVPKVALGAGYKFLFPTLAEALNDLLGEKKSDAAKATA